MNVSFMSAYFMNDIFRMYAMYLFNENYNAIRCSVLLLRFANVAEHAYGSKSILSIFYHITRKILDPSCACVFIYRTPAVATFIVVTSNTR